MAPLHLLLLFISISFALAVRLVPTRLVRLGSAIVAGCLMIPTSPLLANDVDEEVVMVPQAVQESTRAPQPIEVRSVAPSGQRASEDDPSYQSSLQREKQKQEERRRARASGKYRNDLCESLGRGC